MYGILKRRIYLGALGVSSSTVLAKSLKWTRTVVPKPTSYMTNVTTGRGELASERELKHLRGISNHLLLGAPASSNKMRGETLNCRLSRKFSSLQDLPAEEKFLFKNAMEIGSGHDLSPPAIALASSEGQKIWVEAAREGSAVGLIPLLASYGTLSEPGLYGLASISAVLNAFDSTSQKQCGWRVCFEYLLATCDPFEKVMADGLTFGKLAFLAYCNGTKVEVFRGNQCDIDDFREHISKCASSKDSYMVSFFDRAHLKQIGGGHISPIGAYHAGQDLVLVIDVSRFEYPFFWIPLPLLWKAMTSIDKATGNHMGCRDESWIGTATHLSQLPLLLRSEDVKDVDEILSLLFGSESTNFGEFIKHVTEVNGLKKDEYLESPRRERKRLVIQEQLLRQLRETELYKRIGRWMDSAHSDREDIAGSGNKHALREIDTNVGPHGATTHSTMKLGSSGRLFSTESANCSKANLPGNDTLTMLLFALPAHMWSGIREPKLFLELNSLVSIDNLPQMLKNEVLSIRQQLNFLMMDLGQSVLSA